MTTQNRTRTIVTLASVVMLLSFADRPAAATPITISNPSFEQNPLGDGAWTIGAPAGWTLLSGGSLMGHYNPADTSYPGASGPGGPLPGTADGEHAAFLRATNGYKYMGQDTGHLIEAGKTYTLTTAIGLPADKPAPNNGYFHTSLRYGGGAFYTSIVDLNPSADTILTAGEFKDFSVSFTAQDGAPYLGQSLKLVIGGSTLAGGTANIDFDNVRLEDDSPPPVSVPFDDFATDPDIAGDWTNSAFYGSTGTATWNAGDQDLDLAGGGGDRLSLLRRTAETRGATDPVTMQIIDYSPTLGGVDWATTGLGITSTAAPTIFDASPRYMFTLTTVAAGAFYEVKRDSNVRLFQSSTFPLASLTFPITLDIVRNGDDYDFMVDGSTIYTATHYSAAQHDSMAYYHITWGDGGLAGTVVSATVDNFGVPPTGAPIPEPATIGALALAVAGLGGYVRRRRNV